MSSQTAAARQRKLTGNPRKIVMTAMLSAIAFLLMFVEFPIPALIPAFVKMRSHEQHGQPDGLRRVRVKIRPAEIVGRGLRLME